MNPEITDGEFVVSSGLSGNVLCYLGLAGPVYMVIFIMNTYVSDHAYVFLAV